VIQEAVLAQDLLVFWGAEELQWVYIDPAIANLQRPDAADCAPFTAWTFEPISRSSATKDQRCYATSFMGTMHTAKAFKCSDNRDRIYGVLGLGCANDERWKQETISQSKRAANVRNTRTARRDRKIVEEKWSPSCINGESPAAYKTHRNAPRRTPPEASEKRTQKPSHQRLL
jgi:hypothetical protein